MTIFSRKIILISLIFSQGLWAQKKETKEEIKPKIEARAQDLRSLIGSTFSPPLSFNGKLYFVATTGVLYESNLELSVANKLYVGKKQTLGNAIIDNGIIYWGDGLHTDKKSTLHAFDIKTGKIKDIEVDGHIERAPFIKENVLYVGLGPSGLVAYSLPSFKKIWHAKDVEKKTLHVDSNVVFYEEKLCITSVYESKALLCFDPKNGKMTDQFLLKKNPKSEIVLKNNLVIGFSTDANMSDSKWTTPSDFYVVDLKLKKLKIEKELRGFNFFAPLIKDNRAFVNLSTGDFISINIEDGKIEYMGEFPEPFINNTFEMNNSICGLGVMGKLMCFSKGKSNWGLSVDKRYMETTVGKISEVDGKIFAPSRIGYFHLEP
jgi:outer membrane protein assembly factor BamB